VGAPRLINTDARTMYRPGAELLDAVEPVHAEVPFGEQGRQGLFDLGIRFDDKRASRQRSSRRLDLAGRTNDVVVRFEQGCSDRVRSIRARIQRKIASRWHSGRQRGKGVELLEFRLEGTFYLAVLNAHLQGQSPRRVVL